MALYLITYDLRKPGRKYDDLYTLLETSWKAKRLAESVWLAELKGPAEAIRDLMLAQLDANDRVAVIEIVSGADWAVQQGMTGGVALLRKYSP
jgi:hypothetical protein